MDLLELTLKPIYLLKTKKKISVCGKLSLNNWKNHKKIEFIIDDISMKSKKLSGCMNDVSIKEVNSNIIVFCLNEKNDFANLIRKTLGEFGKIVI